MNTPNRKTKLREFFKKLDLDGQKNYAEKCGTSIGYIEQVYRGHRNAGTKLAKLLVANSGGELKLIDIRPDYFD